MTRRMANRVYTRDDSATAGPTTASAPPVIADVETLRPRSLRAQAYDAIKRRIITLAYAPGEYLNEARISEQLGIGRTPVHQALDRLMVEGMIEIMPRKGVMVRPVSLDEFLQLTEVRLINEPYCAQLAAGRATARELDALRVNLERTANHIAARDVEGLMQLDREFHAIIAGAARNKVLAEVLRGLHERSLRFWFISLSDQPHHRRVGREHEAVFAALEARDGVRAAAAVRAHIESAREKIKATI
jgi:DNA-binding GntR family transcriptional regulator